MQDHYDLLRTIHDIVKLDPQPEHYGCRPRELILRQLQEWSYIQQQLSKLEAEGLVVTEQQDTLIIRITRAGLEKMRVEDSVVKD